MKNHPPRREIPEWSPRVEFEVTEVELKEVVVLLEEELGLVVGMKNDQLRQVNSDGNDDMLHQ